MKPTEALASGLAGASALTVLHETARRLVPDAPRVDVIGMRALAKSLRTLGRRPPRRERLFDLTMAGDLASNTLYYALVGVGGPEGAPTRGAALGVVAGLGTVFLPPRLGLGRQPGRDTPWTQAMTVAWYTVGGLAAGAAYRQLAAEDAPRAAPEPAAGA